MAKGSRGGRRSGGAAGAAGQEFGKDGFITKEEAFKQAYDEGKYNLLSNNESGLEIRKVSMEEKPNAKGEAECRVEYSVDVRFQYEGTVEYETEYRETKMKLNVRK